MRVYDLIPGDQVRLGEYRAIFFQQAPHPLYTNLKLVIWWMPDESRWSHDALSHNQIVGEADPSNNADRQRRLREVIRDAR